MISSCVLYDISSISNSLVRSEEKCFGEMNMKISKNSPQLHFGVTKKDPGLVFHFDVLHLFKSWSKLSLTRIQMSKTNLKKIRKWKNQRT